MVRVDGRRVRNEAPVGSRGRGIEEHAQCRLHSRRGNCYMACRMP